MTSTVKSCDALPLKSCPHCDRTFNPSALAKHVAICGKLLRKRSVFDSAQQRRGGNELFRCVRFERQQSLDAARRCKLSPSPSSKTRATSLKSSAALGGSRKADTNSPPYRANGLGTPYREARLERCPHCDRTFNPKALEQHIDWCREKTVIASFCLGDDSSDDVLQAKKRIEARKNYKPPTLR